MVSVPRVLSLFVFARPVILDIQRVRPSASKIKSRIPAKNERPSISPGLIKLGHFRGENFVPQPSKRSGVPVSRRPCANVAFIIVASKYVGNEPRKRGCWHNSGIFLEILREHRYFHVLSIPFVVFSGRTDRSNALRLLRNGSSRNNSL